MSTCKRLDLEMLRSQLTMPENLPRTLLNPIMVPKMETTFQMIGVILTLKLGKT